jgi:hypothetical protein
MADGAQKIVPLGFGKYVRADRIYLLEPIPEGERGRGRRTRVWVEGIAEPIIASRTERTILHDMGHDAATRSPIVDDALALAERIVEDADKGRVDVAEITRRARKLLDASTRAGESLF